MGARLAFALLALIVWGLVALEIRGGQALAGRASIQLWVRRDDTPVQFWFIIAAHAMFGVVFAVAALIPRHA